MSIEHDGMSLAAHDSRPSVIRTDTNTIVIKLAEDETLAFIAELAEAATHRAEAYIVIEIDKITYPRRVFE